MVENKSERAVVRYFSTHHYTVRKMCQFAAPPGYRRTPAPVSPTLAPFVAIIDAILEADKQVQVKQRHTAVRIRERLRDEYATAATTPWCASTSTVWRAGRRRGLCRWRIFPAMPR